MERSDERGRVMTPTARPWRNSPPIHLDSQAAIFGADGHLIVNFGDGGNGVLTHKANAAHIVHCVNTHDALVEALERIRDGCGPDSWEGQIAVETIAKAKGETS